MGKASRMAPPVDAMAPEFSTAPPKAPGDATAGLLRVVLGLPAQHLKQTLPLFYRQIPYRLGDGLQAVCVHIILRSGASIGASVGICLRNAFVFSTYD